MVFGQVVPTATDKVIPDSKSKSSNMGPDEEDIEEYNFFAEAQVKPGVIIPPTKLVKARAVADGRNHSNDFINEESIDFKKKNQEWKS